MSIGQLALLADDRELVQRAYDRLLESPSGCVTPGLMGSSWSGPVALMLGRLALALGQAGDAKTYLDEALQVTRSMKAPPYTARALEILGDAEEQLGNYDTAESHRCAAKDIVSDLSLRLRPCAPGAASPSTSTQTAAHMLISIEPHGDVCEVRFGDAEATLKQTKGLTMIRRLLAEPEKDIHVLELSGATEAVDAGDAGPALDEQARSDYKTRVTDLQEELEEATELGDQGRIDTIREELDFITRELSRAFGLGGRERRTGSAAEKARVNVRRRIKDAIRRIQEQIPDAGRYLENTIKTGTYCRYSPM